MNQWAEYESSNEEKKTSAAVKKLTVEFGGRWPIFRLIGLS